MEIDLDIPAKLSCLFEPESARYRVLYGGRGSAKSWSVAKALIVKSIQRPLRILCAREFQASISDSVMALLSDQIKSMGVNDLFDIQRSVIYGKNGSEFLFAGLKHNIASIKSMEGIDIAWCEEAHTISKSSWDVLIPTIRKNGSEIWITMNPELDTDETYKRFILNPPTDSVVQKVNWSDNPWFPDVLRQEKDDLKERDPDAYLNVWEGNTRQMLDGAVYANELRAAQEAGRIKEIPIDTAIGVSTFWDLGWADNTSIWFVQSVPGGEVRVIDFYQNHQKPIDHYVNVIQNKGYVYKDHWLPHDAENKNMTGKSVKDIMQAMGLPVRITPKLSVSDGINALRMLLNRVWFHDKNCAEGLQALRHYRYDVDPNTKQFSKTPLHDQNSHAADAARYMAVGLEEHSDSWGAPLKVNTKWVV